MRIGIDSLLPRTIALEPHLSKPFSNRGGPMSPTRARDLVLLIGALLAAPGVSASAQSLAITGGTIIDGTGREPVRDGVVLIADGRITSVGSARDVRVPASATVIDARGKYIIPGLMDANLHLFLNLDL